MRLKAPPGSRGLPTAVTEWRPEFTFSALAPINEPTLDEMVTVGEPVQCRAEQAVPTETHTLPLPLFNDTHHSLRLFRWYFLLKLEGSVLAFLGIHNFC
jgi:hypothetical protein